MVSRARAGALAFSLALACAAAPTRVSVVFEPDALRESASAVEVFVVGACTEVTPGTIPARPFARTTLRRGEPGMALGATPTDRFGVYALARDASCDVVASGCTDATRGTADVRVVVRSVVGAGCAIGTVCARGVCAVSDASVDPIDASRTDAGLDAGLDASVDLDANEDAAVFCDPACGSGLACTASGCLPTIVSAERQGSGGWGLRGTDDGAGAMFVAGLFDPRITFDARVLTNRADINDGFIVRQTGSTIEWLAQVELGTQGGEPPWLHDIDYDDGLVWVAGHTGSMNGYAGFSAPTCTTLIADGGTGSGPYLASFDAATGCPTSAFIFSGGPASAIDAREGMVYLAGHHGGATIFGTTTDATPATRAWIAAVHPSDRTAPWIHPIRVDDGIDARAIVATSTRICVGGNHLGTLYRDLPFRNAPEGAFIECVDASGALVHAFDAPGGTVLVLAADEAGDLLYAGGQLDLPMTFARPGMGPFVLAPVANQDAWIAAFALSTGEFRYAARFGGVGGDTTRTLSVGPSGDLYASFTFSSDIHFAGTATSADWTSADGGHALARFTRGGDCVWTRALLQSDNVFAGDQVVGFGLHTAHFASELAYVAWAPGRIEADGLVVPQLWNPYMVARYREGAP